MEQRMAEARARVNPAENSLMPAGRPSVGKDESASSCFDMTSTMRATPEKSKKFTALTEPGTRVRHYGYRG